MNSKDLYFRLLRYVRPHTRVFALSLLGTVIAAATEPLIPALIQPLLDGSFVAKDPHSIRLMPLLLVAVFIIRGLAIFVGALAMEWIAQRVVTDLRGDLFARLLTLQTAFGAAKMALESPDNPTALRARVTSPGGTTERAISVFQDEQLDKLIARSLAASLALLETPSLLTEELDSLVAKALEAAHHRSEELGNLLGGQS